MIYGPFSGVLSERKSDPNDGEVWLPLPDGTWRYGNTDESISKLSAAFEPIACGTPTKVTIGILRNADYQGPGDFVVDAVVSLAVNGVLVGANLAKSESWGTTQVLVTYEATMNLPTAAQFAAGQVTVELSATRVDNTGTVAQAIVADMQMTVED
jgi:hypothetical protein